MFAGRVTYSIGSQVHVAHTSDGVTPCSATRVGNRRIAAITGDQDTPEGLADDLRKAGVRAADVCSKCLPAVKNAMGE
jgi:hypothetical protein